MRAPKRRCSEKNIVRKLMNREISVSSARLFHSGGDERFRNFSIKGDFDTHDPSTTQLKLSFLRKRSKVVEIVAAKEIIFALSGSGVCVAFARGKDGNKRLCYLNIQPDEVVRSLFYNKLNDSIITVSVFKRDNFSSLNCRSTPLEYIRRQKPQNGFSLFESESLMWPGFVEFDDVNGKVLTYSSTSKTYKIWDLKNYTHLFSIADKNISEVKVSPGIILVIYKKAANGGHVPLKILSIENGTVLQSFKHQLHRSKKIDFIEQFNEKLLVKQESESLQIVDVRDGDRTEVGSSHFLTPSAFIFLYENQLFLTFRHRSLAVWNFRGERMLSFDDHTLLNHDSSTNNIYITANQDIIVAYCQARDNSQHCVINVSNIITGKTLATINAPNDPHALDDVTSLFYNEERNEIYTGKKDGRILVWSN